MRWMSLGRRSSLAAVCTTSVAALALLGIAATSPALAVLLAALLFVGLARWIPRSSGQTRAYWWMHPGWLMSFALLPGVSFALLRNDTYYVERWGTPKFIRSEDLLLILALLALFIFGAVLGGRALRSAHRPVDNRLALSGAQLEWLDRATRVLFWLTVAGYVLWLIIAIARGLDLTMVLGFVGGGSIIPIKTVFAPVGGVTTIAQFAPPALLGLIILRRADSGFATTRYIAVLVALTVVRTYLRGERSALLEVAIPAIVLLMVLPKRDRGRGWLSVLPLWAPLVVIVFFGGVEYTRSWNTPYVQALYGGKPYSEFVLDRIGAYYGTSPNNGVLLRQNDHRTTPLPWYTMRWVWNFPGVSLIAPYPKLSGSNVPGDYKLDLAGQANPMFNNNSGVLLPVFDLGVIGGGFFWLAAGLAGGWLFALFRATDPVGLMAYPVLVVGLVEAGRVLYWTDGRALPPIVGAFVLGMGVRRRSTSRSTEKSVTSLGEGLTGPPPHGSLARSA